MKKMMIALAAALMMSASALAQEDKTPGQRPERKFDKTEMAKYRTDGVVKKYNLNEKQAKELLDLNIRYADKMGGRHHGPMGPRPEGRPMPPRDGQQAMPSPEGKRPELTEEQKAKMEADRKQYEETMKAYDAEIQKIMTPEQYKEYKADMEKRGPRGGMGHRRPHPQQQ